MVIYWQITHTTRICLVKTLAYSDVYGYLMFVLYVLKYILEKKKIVLY